MKQTTRDGPASLILQAIMQNFVKSWHTLQLTEDRGEKKGTSKAAHRWVVHRASHRFFVGSELDPR